MTTADVLRDARALIEDPANFWQAGRNAGVSAISVCASFAIHAASENRARPDQGALNTFLRVIGADLDNGLLPIYAYNDSHGHVEVLAAFDRAIMLAERAA